MMLTYLMGSGCRESLTLPCGGLGWGLRLLLHDSIGNMMVAYESDPIHEY